MKLRKARINHNLQDFKFKIPATTLSKFLINKEKILSSANDSTKDQKQVRGPGNPEVDECFLKWFKQAKNKPIPVSVPMIRANVDAL